MDVHCSTPPAPIAWAMAHAGVVLHRHAREQGRFSGTCAMPSSTMRWDGAARSMPSIWMLPRIGRFSPEMTRIRMV
jgi:hypothetical protein